MSKIKKQKVENDVLNSTEYKQLKDLLDANILSKIEFEDKVEKLKDSKSVKTTNSNVHNYRIIDGYSEGLALAINDNLDYGYVDSNGKVVIDFIFEHAENFSNGIAKISIKGQFKKIDCKGNII